MSATRSRARNTKGYGQAIPKPRNCKPEDYRDTPLHPKQKSKLLFIILRTRETIILALTKNEEYLWEENERMSHDPDGSVGGVNKPFNCYIDTGRYHTSRLLRELAKDIIDCVKSGTYRQGAEE